jgi:chromosomal replication initiation ATPase DnaA
MTEADRLAEFASIPHELAEIVVLEATRRDIRLSDLRGEKRATPLVLARRAIIRTAYPKYGSPLIGRALNRDHSTVLYWAWRMDLRMTNRRRTGERPDQGSSTEDGAAPPPCRKRAAPNLPLFEAAA